MGDGLLFSVVLKIVFQVPGQLLFGLMVLVDILLQPQAQDGLVERYHGQQVRDVLAGVAPGIGSKALVDGFRRQTVQLLRVRRRGRQVEHATGNLYADFLVHHASSK